MAEEAVATEEKATGKKKDQPTATHVSQANYMTAHSEEVFGRKIEISPDQAMCFILQHGDWQRSPERVADREKEKAEAAEAKAAADKAREEAKAEKAKEREVKKAEREKKAAEKKAAEAAKKAESADDDSDLDGVDDDTDDSDETAPVEKKTRPARKPRASAVASKGAEDF